MTVRTADQRQAQTMKRITIADIARRAGVSTGAVSYALNDRPGVSAATRDRIRSVATEMGWEPSSAARSLSGARTETIGLTLARDPSTLGIESFYMQFVAGIESVLAPRGHALLLQVVPDTTAELSALRRWHAARRVDGVIVTDLRPEDPRVAWLMQPGSLPAVAVGDTALAGGLTNVWTDDTAAVAESLRYLHALGHRSVARVAGLEVLGHTVIRDEAFVREAQGLGLEGVVVRADYLPEAGAVATRRLLTGPDRPTAVVYDNDVMALAGLGVAAELGLRVPNDVSLIAWDDSPLCQATYPALSALSHDVVGYGAHAARLLFGVLDGQPPAHELDSVPTLVPRGSTGRPGGGRPAAD